MEDKLSATLIFAVLSAIFGFLLTWNLIIDFAGNTDTVNIMNEIHATQTQTQIAEKP